MVKSEDSFRVLHVDDDDIFLEETKYYLEKIARDKVQLESLVDPTQVLRKVQETNYDVIIADYQMPAIDGLKLLELLRKEQVTLPFIMLTGRGREEIAIQALNLGAARYIKKGFDPESLYRELLHAITTVVSHKRAQKAVQESEARYRALVELSPVPIVVHSGGKAVFLNSAAARAVGGASPADFIGRSLWEFIHPAYHESTKERALQLYKKKGPFPPIEIQLLHQDGKVIDVELVSSSIDYMGQLASQAIFMDITNRKKTEEALRESEQKFRHFIEHSPDGIILVDEHGYITDWNRGLEKMTGLKQDEIKGKLVWKVLFQLLPIEQRTQDHYRRYQTAIQHLLHTGHSPWLNQLADMEIQGGDGSSRIVQQSVFVIKSQKRFRVGAILRDITAHKQQEKEKEHLMNTYQQVNESLKEFASMTSHDLKTPLRRLNGLTDWLLKDYGEKLDEEGQMLFAMMKKQVELMETLISGIFAYSCVGQEQEERVEIKLSSLLEEVQELLVPPTHIKIQVAPDLPIIRGEKTRLFQIFENLLSNAIKFMDKPAGLIQIYFEEKATHWQFSVSDNGRGIPEKYFDRIFQMFQPLVFTKSTESTGMGLAITKKIVETYGGRIWIESQIGEGSTFFFTLLKSH